MVHRDRSIVDVDALVALVREMVRAELSAAGVAGAVYSSSNLPPHTTARTYAAWCRAGRVEGAERDGRGWRCTAAAWREARARGTSRTPVVRPVADDADAMLAAAGLRGTR